MVEDQKSMIQVKDRMKEKLFLVIITWFVFFGCAEEKIPVTTSSSEARQNFLTGRDYMEKVQYEDAVSYLEKAVALDPDFALAHLYLSRFQESTNKRYELFEKAKSLAGKVSEGERLLILAYDAGVSGQLKQQEEYLQKRIKIYPKDERALNDLAAYYFNQHEYPKAIVYYKRALKINPQFSTPYNQLGYAYRHLEKYQAAEKAFKIYIKLIPEDPNPYDSYAELLLKMGEFDVSIESYEKALEIDPDFTPSHYGIASNLIYMRQYQKARSQLKHLYKVARTEEQRAKAIYGMAITYLAENDIENTLDEINTLYERAKGNNDITSMIENQILKSSIMYENNRLDDAEEMLANAGELLENSDLPDVIRFNLRRRYLYHLTRLAVNKMDLDQAKEYAEQFYNQVGLNENRLQMTYYYTLSALIACAEKDCAKAITELEKSNQDDPFNNFQMGMAYLKINEKNKAAEKFESVLEYNGLVSLTYIIIRQRAEKILSKLSAI